MKNIINKNFSDNESVQVMIPDSEQQLIIGFDDLNYCNHPDFYHNSFLSHPKRNKFPHGDLENRELDGKNFINHIFDLNKPYFVIGEGLLGSRFKNINLDNYKSVQIINFIKNKTTENVVADISNYEHFCKKAAKSIEPSEKIFIKDFLNKLKLEENAYCKLLICNKKVAYLNIKGEEIISPKEFMDYLTKIVLKTFPINSLDELVDSSSIFCNYYITPNTKPSMVTIYEDYIEIAVLELVSGFIKCNQLTPERNIEESKYYKVCVDLNKYKLYNKKTNFKFRFSGKHNVPVVSTSDEVQEVKNLDNSYTKKKTRKK